MIAGTSWIKAFRSRSVRTRTIGASSLGRNNRIEKGTESVALANCGNSRPERLRRGVGEALVQGLARVRDASDHAGNAPADEWPTPGVAKVVAERAEGEVDFPGGQLRGLGLLFRDMRQGRELCFGGGDVCL